MTELFANLPEVIKDLTKITVDIALQQDDPGQAARILNNFVSKLPPDPQIQEFADFYINMRLEQKKNEE